MAFAPLSAFVLAELDARVELYVKGEYPIKARYLLAVSRIETPPDFGAPSFELPELAVGAGAAEVDRMGVIEAGVMEGVVDFGMTDTGVIDAGVTEAEE